MKIFCQLLTLAYILATTLAMQWSLPHEKSSVEQAKLYEPNEQHFSKEVSNRTQKKTFYDFTKHESTKEQNQQVTNGRLLQVAAKQSIRITVDNTDLAVIRSGENGAAKTTTSNLNFIQRAVLVAKSYFGKRLKVFRIPRVYTPAICYEFSTFVNDQLYGIADSDLHIYVRYITDKTGTYRATGKSCKHYKDTTGTYPDPEFSVYRPIVGFLKFNTYKIVDGQALTNKLFSTVATTAIHEMMHILGFDASLYGKYIDPSTKNLYAYSVAQKTTAVHASRTAIVGDTYEIVTPKVKKWARDFFDCQTITGMMLENEDAADPGSHWERLAVYDELMTGTQLGPQKAISGLTFALLQDMGWYQVDGAFNDTDNYGYKEGCDFYYGGCYGAFTSDPSFSKYFCDSVALKDISKCATNFLGKAVCIKADALSDGCGIFGAHSPCVDPDISDDGYRSFTLEQHATDSFCLDATLTTVGLPSFLLSRCYRYRCFDTSIEIYVSTFTITCTSAQAGNSKTVGGMTGSLACPKFDDFCKNSRKTCPNWCSKNGICTRGVCNCIDGFSGEDCSKISCTLSEFYDHVSGKCMTTCVTKYYPNVFSHTCLKCSNACNQCRDQSTICTDCIASVTNPQYFYSPTSTCYSVCPSTTFRKDDKCIDCDATTKKCGSCDYSPTNCTSCVGGLYLENPKFGDCVSLCVSPNVLRDVVNMKCVPNCVQNLVQIAGTCDKCPNGKFKLISDSSCNIVCPTGYYSNPTLQLCQNCAPSCKNCGGIYAENCTSCKSTATEKYLLVNICIASCPKGYYTHDTDGKCYECPNANHCASCILTGGIVKCTSCLYGYYLKADKTCSQSCPQYFFKNLWNHTCDPCDSSCGDCSTGNKTSCSNCKGSSFFLTNYTGGFCLTECPADYYVPSGKSCLACHKTCRKCSGVTSKDCKMCIEGLYRYSGVCRYACPPATYHQDQDWSCQDCHEQCTFCFGPTNDNCTACATGLFLDNFTCVTACPFERRENQWNVCYGERMVISVMLMLLFWL